jgi:hypothetical protein
MFRHHHLTGGPALEGESSGQKAQGAALCFIIWKPDDDHALTLAQTGTLDKPDMPSSVQNETSSGKGNNHRWTQMNTDSDEGLINTPLQWGDSSAARATNRFNGLLESGETVETVSALFAALRTPLCVSALRI